MKYLAGGENNDLHAAMKLLKPFGRSKLSDVRVGIAEKGKKKGVANFI